MDEILELVNNHIDEVLANSELLQKVCSYLNTSFSLTKENLATNPNILRISDFIMPKIEEDPSIVLLFPYDNIDDTLANTYLRSAVMNHFIPTYEQIKENPSMGPHIPIGVLERLLRTNPRMIKFFPKSEIKNYANKVEFVATEEELLEVPELCEFPGVMERSIEENPHLLKYLHTVIDTFVIYDALEQVELTRQDFLDNPFLCTDSTICEGKYLYYYRSLTTEQKIVIVTELISLGRIDEISELPFFNHTLNPMLEDDADIDKVVRLIKVITPDLSNAENNNVNDENWSILSAIIDGIGAYRYRLGKNTFKFKSADVLIDRFEKYFLEMNPENEDILLGILTREVVDFMEATPEDDVEESVRISLLNIYRKYENNNRTMPTEGEDRALITEICNYMLNFHRDKFIASERVAVEELINKYFSLKQTRIQSILHSKRRNRVISRLRDFKNRGVDCYDDFDRLKITLELRELDPNFKDSQIEEIYKHIIDTLLETGNINTDGLYKYLEETIFGEREIIPAYLKIGLKECTAKIVDIINKEINESARAIRLAPEESAITLRDRAKYTREFVPKNLCMTNKGITDSTLARLIVLLMDDPDRCRKATLEIDKAEPLRRIIPFFGSIPKTKELSVEMLMDILANYPRIERRINMNGTSKNLEFCFEKLVGFATDYGMSSSLLRTIITPNIVGYIGEHNVGKYALFYLEHLFDRQDSTIPIVNGETGRYTYKSSFKDQDRMVIGKMYDDSCLDLNDSSGYDTFFECLAGPHGDAILIRDITSNELIGRVLAIRRGNLIQLQLRNLDGRIDEKEYQLLISEIGKQMMTEAQEKGDNLEAIVVATAPHTGKREDRLKTEFPHADWGGFYEMVIPQEDVEFNFTVKPVVTYHPQREKIREQATDQELTRLKAISIKMMPDSMAKEDLERNFEPVIFEGTGNQILLGEDWYIIHNNGEIVEEVIVPTKDNRQQVEIGVVKEKLGLSKGAGTHYG